MQSACLSLYIQNLLFSWTDKLDNLKCKYSPLMSLHLGSRFPFSEENSLYF